MAFEYARKYTVESPPADLTDLKTDNFYAASIVGTSITAVSIAATSIVGTSVTATRIGIGTTNPTSPLTVIGNTLITGVTTVGLGTTSTPSNSQLSFELITNTNLRIKVRGTDGVLRSANITLA